MGQNINKIKTRINSINGAYKVTSAMKLVSSVKLKTWKYKLIQNQEFTNELKLACEDIFNYVDPLYLPLASNKNLNGKKLYIIVSSSLGLCGSYNSNIFKMTNSKITKDDDAIILGKKGLSFFKNGSFELIDSFKAYTSVKDEKIINQLMNFCVHNFMKDEYKEIHILYTKYKNAISFIPTDYCLLPLTMEQNKKVVGYPPLLEPTPSKLLEKLIPFYLKNILYSCLLESEVCEQASRSNAMENATKNAEELLDNLQIEFSKARQSAITQEITEIVGAANAL